MENLRCRLRLHNWKRWYLTYPKMSMQQRSCRACPAVQLRDADRRPDGPPLLADILRLTVFYLRAALNTSVKLIKRRFPV